MKFTVMYNILYNADSSVLSLFPIVYFIKNSSNNDIIVIEQPEVHLEEFKETLKELLKMSKAKLVLVSNEAIST